MKYCKGTDNELMKNCKYLDAKTTRRCNYIDNCVHAVNSYALSNYDDEKYAYYINGREVSKTEYISVERAVGFSLISGNPDECVTDQFECKFELDWVRITGRVVKRETNGKD